MLCENITLYKDGVVVQDPSTLSDFDIVEAVIDVPQGYEFYRWVDENNVPLNPQPIQVGASSFEIKVYCNQTYKVQFKEVIPLSTVTVTPVCDANKGTVSNPVTVMRGESVTIEATSIVECEYKFYHWVDENGRVVDHNPVYTFTPQNDVTYTAIFEPTSYTVHIPQIIVGGSVSNHGGTFYVGNVYSGTASAHTGYMFDGWYDVTGPNEILLETQDTLSYTIVKSTSNPCQTHIYIEPRFSELL